MQLTSMLHEIKSKISAAKVVSNVPTFQQHTYNINNNLIINNIYIMISVGTPKFCWNTLEHICNIFYKVALSVGTLFCSNSLVGTFQQKLTYCMHE